MRVQVIPFGVLKDWLGSPAGTVELPDGATVAALMERLRTTLPAGAPEQMLRGIAVSVNAEYAQAGRVLHDGLGRRCASSHCACGCCAHGGRLGRGQR